MKENRSSAHLQFLLWQRFAIFLRLSFWVVILTLLESHIYAVAKEVACNFSAMHILRFKFVGQRWSTVKRTLEPKPERESYLLKNRALSCDF